MFTNLIESNPDVSGVKRRSSFFLITVAAYAIVLFAAGIVSVYAYDAQLEVQTSSLELMNWVPPVERVTPQPVRENPTTVRRPRASDAAVDRNTNVPIRTVGVTTTDDPTKIPDKVGTTAAPAPPVTGKFKIGPVNVDPPTFTGNNSNGCLACPTTPPIVKVDATPPPEPLPVKPKTERLPPQILRSKAISLPQPPYPELAKQIHVQGSVSVQILVSESGLVLSAQAVSGNAFLRSAAEDAAKRARFTPTMLNGQPVKVQGVIVYNFVLQ